MPQIFMVLKAKKFEYAVNWYIYAVTLYRSSYIANWIYRMVEEHHYDGIACASGALQTLILALFIAYAKGCAGFPTESFSEDDPESIGEGPISVIEDLGKKVGGEVTGGKSTQYERNLLLSVDELGKVEKKSLMSGDELDKQEK